MRKRGYSFHVMQWFAFIGLCFAMVVVSSCGANKTAATAKDARLWEYKTKFHNMYSWDYDVKLGQAVQEKQFASARQQGIYLNPAKQKNLRQRIQGITKRLVGVSDRPKLPYEVHIYDNPKVANAFCMPGGKIGVFTGLFHPQTGLVDINSDDEIAAVLGHEIAHATLRHVTRRLTTYQSLGFVGAIVGAGIGHAGGSLSQSLFNRAFRLSASLYFPSYSRKHETEADKVGFYYMVKAGYDPNAAIRIWSRLDKRLKEKGKGSQSFLASHPSSGKRAQFLKGYLNDAYELQGKTK